MGVLFFVLAGHALMSLIAKIIELLEFGGFSDFSLRKQYFVVFILVEVFVPVFISYHPEIRHWPQIAEVLDSGVYFLFVLNAGC